MDDGFHHFFSDELTSLLWIYDSMVNLDVGYVYLPQISTLYQGCQIICIIEDCHGAHIIQSLIDATVINSIRPGPRAKENESVYYFLRR